MGKPRLSQAARLTTSSGWPFSSRYFVRTQLLTTPPCVDTAMRENSPSTTISSAAFPSCTASSTRFAGSAETGADAAAGALLGAGTCPAGACATGVLGPGGGGGGRKKGCQTTTI